MQGWLNKQIERWKLLLHIMKYAMKGVNCMEEKTVSTGAVKNVFKNGRMPTREAYTKAWIDMINHIERLKANQ